MAATVGTFQARQTDVELRPGSKESNRAGDRSMGAEPEMLTNGKFSTTKRSDGPGPKQSLQHILTTTEPLLKAKSRSQGQVTPPPSSKPSTPTKQPTVWTDVEAEAEDKEDQASVQNDSYTRAAEFNPSHTMTVAHTRRNANGTIGSVYSGNKIRHLKKEDGIPLWRKDIQLNFLQCVFGDESKVFTKAFDGTKGHTFADIYVDAMARSSKTSKILKEKLLADRGNAMHMAMICLLVNVGRMNTTLNFFPEMRAQLRTYHSIPSLQASQDSNSDKQLQDAPRLKSILKGASEDANQPSTIEKIKALPVPRTNPVNLIFVLSQYVPKISEIHFFPPRDFFDLVMRSTLSSKSRARAFLWLLWFYLESDFSAEMALQNPFGPGLYGNEENAMPFKVPEFEHLTEPQADAENIDTEEEKAYGESKRQERIRILQEDETVGPPLKKAKKSKSGKPKESDYRPFTALEHMHQAYLETDPAEDLNNIATSDDPTRTPSPSSVVQLKSKHVDFDDHSLDMNGTPTMGRSLVPTNKADSSHPQRLVLKTRIDNYPQSSSPAPPGSGHPILHSGPSNGLLGSRRQRPETSHQKAVNMNRKMRIEHILHSRIRTTHRESRKMRKRDISSFGIMVMNRIRNLPDMYDTDEEGSWGPGGLLPYRNKYHESQEREDYGEEALAYKKSIDRAVRRLHREENASSRANFSASYSKRKRKLRGYDEPEQKDDRSKKRRREDYSHVISGGRSRDVGGREETLDDLDLDLLGEGRDDDGMYDETGVDDSGAEDGDLTEDEMMTAGVQ